MTQTHLGTPGEDKPRTGTRRDPTDSNALTAMSNPLRMRILGILRVEGIQTVGSISTRIHEAPGSVSYHLSRLSRAGLVEKIHHHDGDMRKSWWEATRHATLLPAARRPDDPGAPHEATDPFRRSAALSYEQAYERYLDAIPRLSADWVEAGTSDNAVLRLTPDETNRMIRDLTEVIHRWSAVADAHVPDDPRTRQVAVILQAFAWIP
ncbi:winged helix-turn-helix domain-containing protein [Bifidobacterium mongoliense]|uniref:winged helix-turn-helix domain-containing protein n=1 Tax=Bifidobacterium mongoliense TaxID=518643 RepID=UPI00264838CC|nr:helix-turn-helix domain-containing protein [Bifidobacterium mongoliense]MDN6025994.1 helix-turn-helix domain-containing protein [Bifidobacterium mongoliense]MDN6050926.1 helix-turn-helix domain-containing protein [Bifidobacterium mongoliense]MDN6720405.1 helix-turn-helix domain-containing protein [Bifidobacterium mongoliense]